MQLCKHENISIASKSLHLKWFINHFLEFYGWTTLRTVALDSLAIFGCYFRVCGLVMVGFSNISLSMKLCTLINPLSTPIEFRTIFYRVLIPKSPKTSILQWRKPNNSNNPKLHVKSLKFNHKAFQIQSRNYPFIFITNWINRSPS
jgi:hypothetical protein